jgi:hypothetical protein
MMLDMKLDILWWVVLLLVVAAMIHGMSWPKE